MTGLLLGPMLRYADADCATVWVETDGPAEVAVRDARSRTFHVAGHHYALVVVQGLGAAPSREYDVRLDGQPVWPPPGDPFPPPELRGPPERGDYRITVGSCRAVRAGAGTGPDALRALARRMIRGERAEWPHALIFLGDQVYADEVSPQTLQFIRSRRDTGRPPYEQVADFEEYTRLYREAWTEPEIRWLLSTVPSAMIFDDHDVRDDWNTSEVWRHEMQAQPWWRARIVGALASYWIYQHLGNLSPAAIEEEGVLARLAPAEDGWPVLAELARRADAEADGRKGHRWSYRRDHAGFRLLVIDSRCGRVLEGEHREMVDDREWDWIERQVSGGPGHLLVATSLPVLLPQAIHQLESWDEAICGSAWGAPIARLGERLRQGVDLEHWAAFRDSWARLIRLVAELGAGRRGPAPASVVFLSGDVHYAYLAEARFPGPAAVRSRVFQVVSSPIRNPVPRMVQRVDRFARTRAGRWLGRVLARTVGLPALPCDWDVVRGPWFDNNLATLELDGPELALTFESTRGEEADPALETLWAGELVRRPLPGVARGPGQRPSHSQPSPSA